MKNPDYDPTFSKKELSARSKRRKKGVKKVRKSKQVTEEITNLLIEGIPRKYIEAGKKEAKYQGLFFKEFMQAILESCYDKQQKYPEKYK